VGIATNPVGPVLSGGRVNGLVIPYLVRHLRKRGMAVRRCAGRGDRNGKQLAKTSATEIYLQMTSRGSR